MTGRGVPRILPGGMHIFGWPTPPPPPRYLSQSTEAALSWGGGDARASCASPLGYAPDGRGPVLSVGHLSDLPQNRFTGCRSMIRTSHLSSEDFNYSLKMFLRNGCLKLFLVFVYCIRILYSYVPVPIIHRYPIVRCQCCLDRCTSTLQRPSAIMRGPWCKSLNRGLLSRSLGSTFSEIRQSSNTCSQSKTWGKSRFYLSRSFYLFSWFLVNCSRKIGYQQTCHFSS